MAIRLFHVFLGGCVLLAAACGSNTAGPGSAFDAGSGLEGGNHQGMRDGGKGVSGHLHTPDGSSLQPPPGADAAVVFDVTPFLLTTITVPVGSHTPTVTFN